MEGKKTIAGRFRNRKEAGRFLAERLVAYANCPEVVVLALPRGGVPVAFEIATAIHAPLDIFVVRKLGVPGQEELALGALASNGTRLLNEPVVQALGITPGEIETVTAKEQAELERRERVYRAGRAPLDLNGRIVILVDDGIATGTTMQAAIAAIRTQQPARVVVAVPVAPLSTCRKLEQEAEEVVCLLSPEDFMAISLWYDEFSQTGDEEVCDLLSRADRMGPDVSASHLRH